MQFEMQFQVRFRSNIRAHRKWFEYLSGGEFFQTAAERYESASNIAKMHALAQEVIQNEIYNKHSGRDRTGALLDSFYALPTGDSTSAGIAVISDPVIAPSKGPFESGSHSSFSYAAFFEEPAFNSFLLGKGVDVMSPIKYRPFFEPLERAVEEQAQESSMKAILTAVMKKMPRVREI